MIVMTTESWEILTPPKAPSIVPPLVRLMIRLMIRQMNRPMIHLIPLEALVPQKRVSKTKR